MRRLHLVQVFDEVVEIFRFVVAAEEIRDVVLDALLAAGHLEQFVIQRDIPLPGQIVISECLVEGDAVCVLGIGQRAVHVEYDGFDRHSVFPGQ